MRNYNLNIAGYNIRLESADGGPDLNPEERFLKNICHTDQYDVIIRVHSGYYKLDEEAERLLVAPYSIEERGMKFNIRENFWSVYRHQSGMFLATNFPANHNKTAVLKFSLIIREWDLWIDGVNGSTDPLEYPLDGLILYYLTVIKGDIMIHASGVNIAGSGYLFSGVSGKGKSTLAQIFKNSGARVIHDDRLIIRNINGRYQMFNTPVYREDKPQESDLNRLFLIEHGKSNKIIPVSGANAVSLVIANCIQHNFSPDLIARFLGSVSIMCSMIPVATLYFRPDRRVIDHILENA
ncbi:MAG: hypothetical protein JXN62_01170 [Bacteroidales bacterium]|nr:hypothetical protein [Bacteroidales bacterium]